MCNMCQEIAREFDGWEERNEHMKGAKEVGAGLRETKAIGLFQRNVISGLGTSRAVLSPLNTILV